MFLLLNNFNLLYRSQHSTVELKLMSTPRPCWPIINLHVVGAE